MWAQLVLIFLLTFSASATSPDEEAAEALAEQEEIPAFDAREEVATRRVSAREQFFAGAVSLSVGFPHLANATLTDPMVLTGRLAALDAEGAQRATSRVAAGSASLQEHRERALDAEDRAAQLERRLLLGLRAQLEAHPELTSSRLEALRAPYKRLMEQAAQAPSDQEVEAAKAAADADLELVRLDEVVRAVQLQGLIPSATPPRPTQDLARLSDPEQAPAAAERLALLRPWLAPSDLALLLDWWTGPRLTAARAAQAAAASARVDEAEIPKHEARSDEIAEMIASLTGSDPLSAAIRGVYEVERETARQMLERAEPTDTAPSELAAEQRAGAAREEAELARAADSRLAERKEAWAAAEERAQAEWSTVRSDAEAATESETALVDRLASLEQHARTLQLPLASLDEKRPDPDVVFAELRTLITDLRGEARRWGGRLVTAQEHVAAVADSLEGERARIAAYRQHAKSEELETLDLWAHAIDDEERAAQQALQTATDAHDTSLRLLLRATEARRATLPLVSRSGRADDRANWPTDLRDELKLSLPAFEASFRGRLQSTRTLGSNPTALWQLFKNGLTLLVVLGAWLAARRFVRPILANVMGRIVRTRRGTVRSVDMLALKLPVERLAVPIVDLLAVWVLLPATRERVPELALVLLVLLQFALYRGGLALFDLLVVSESEHRPALRVMRDRSFKQARLTVKVVLIWAIVRSFALFIASDILTADTLGSVTASVACVAGAILTVWLLHGWEPVLRARLARESLGRSGSWLSRGPSVRALQSLYGAMGLSILSARLFVELAYQFGREGSRLGQLLNLVGRYQLSEKVEESAAGLSEETRAVIVAADCPEGAWVPRESALEALRTAVKNWQKTRRLGVIGLVGDRGDGKRSFLDHVVAEDILPSTLPRIRVRLERRLTTERELFTWLSEVFSLPDVPTTADGAVDALEALESRVLILEEMHLCFLRTVGGFEALQAFLYVLNATAHVHFWLISFHRPAWMYLSRLGELANTDSFHVIPLDPMGEKSLRALTVGRLASDTAKVDFSTLGRRDVLGGDPQVQAERTTSLYFRLLAEASGGNPAVALHLWAGCLLPQKDGYGVRMGDAVKVDTVEGLASAHLFALTALRTQDRLALEELAKVTNLGTGSVRQTIKHLSARGLIVVEDGWVSIALPELARVTRTLRRSNFLQWSV